MDITAISRWLVLLLSSFALSVHAYYDPTVGRWINRDPIGEVGERNLYQFVNNNPVLYIDPIGLCPKQCGVESFEFRPYRTLIPFSPGGWRLQWTGGVGSKLQYDLQYAFQIKIRFRKDQNHDPSSCRYVQLVQVSAAVNGTPIAKSDRGVPADGELHLDGNWPNPPGWTDDKVEKHLDLWPAPSGRDYTQIDAPGLRGVLQGDSISYDAVFIGLVKDITRRDPVTGELLTVATTSQHLTANGTVPNLRVSPGKLSK